MTMQITYEGRDRDGTNLLIPDPDGLAPTVVHIPFGGTAEVPDNLGKRLVEQDPGSFKAEQAPKKKGGT